MLPSIIIGFLVLILICCKMLMMPICCLVMMLIHDKLLLWNLILLLMKWFFDAFADWWRIGTGSRGLSVMLPIVHYRHYGFLRTSCCMMVFMMGSWITHCLLASFIDEKIHMLLSLCHGLSMMHGLHIVILWMISWVSFGKAINSFLSLLRLEYM